MNRVLIDASNLGGGGGVQVAASFLDELAGMVADEKFVAQHPWISNVTVLCNSRVLKSLRPETPAGLTLLVDEPRPWSLARWRRVSLFDVSFVVFGPEYAVRRARRRIVGYADVRSVYPFSAPQSGDGWSRFRAKLRGFVSRRLIGRVDLVVVETDALAIRLREIGIKTNVAVVSNTINAIFDDGSRWRSVELSRPLETDVMLAYVARPYPHKNHDFLPLVRREALRLGMSLRFVVTLKSEEWKAQSSTFREACVNVGELSVDELPSIYEQVDGTIFPSLLEAFSATPLEAMKMSSPLFASDRDFVRSVCKTAACYIDPLEPASAAQAIVSALLDKQSMVERVEAGRQIVAELPTARDRALQYVALIDGEFSALQGSPVD